MVARSSGGCRRRQRSRRGKSRTWEELWTGEEGAAAMLPNVCDRIGDSALFGAHIIGKACLVCALSCMQKQQALIKPASIDLALPSADMSELWQTTAEEQRHEELCGHLTSLYF